MGVEVVWRSRVTDIEKEGKKITFPFDDSCETPVLQRTFKDDSLTSDKEEKSSDD